MAGDANVRRSWVVEGIRVGIESIVSFGKSRHLEREDDRLVKKPELYKSVWNGDTLQSNQDVRVGVLLRGMCCG